VFTLGLGPISNQENKIFIKHIEVNARSGTIAEMYSSFKRKPTIACYDLMVLVFFWVLNLGFEIPKALEPFFKVNVVKNFIAEEDEIRRFFPDLRSCQRTFRKSTRRS